MNKKSALRKYFVLLVGIVLFLTVISASEIFSAGEPSGEPSGAVVEDFNDWELVNGSDVFTPHSKVTFLGSDKDGEHYKYRVKQSEWVYEDGIVKRYDEAKSLMGKSGYKIVADEDGQTMLNIVDFNATSRTFQLNIANASLIGKNVPLKIDGVEKVLITPSKIGSDNVNFTVNIGIDESLGFGEHSSYYNITGEDNNWTMIDTYVRSGALTQNTYNFGADTYIKLENGDDYRHMAIWGLHALSYISNDYPSVDVNTVTFKGFNFSVFASQYCYTARTMNITAINITKIVEGNESSTLGNSSWDAPYGSSADGWYQNVDGEGTWTTVGKDGDIKDNILGMELGSWDAPNSVNNNKYFTYELNATGITQNFRVNNGWLYYYARVDPLGADTGANFRSLEAGVLYIPYYEFEVIVQTAPSNPVVSLSPLDSFKNVDVYCVGTVNDSDVGDTLTVDVEVFKNNVSQFVLSGNPAFNNVHYNFTIDSANFSVGDEWGCGMRVYDGTDYNPIGWVNATQFTVIQNQIPTVSWDSESPSNDSHYNLSELPAVFNFQVSDLDAGENIVACHLSDGTINYQSIYSVTEGTNYSLNASSFAAEGTYLMRINCDDGIVNGTSSLKTVVYDVTPPDIPLISPAWPTSDNLSIAYDKTSVPFNISCTDTNYLWSFKVNLSKSGVYYWGYYQEEINNTNIEYNTATDLSSLPNGSILTETVCYDSHTSQDLRPYYNEKSVAEGMLSFHNSEDVIIIQSFNKEGLTSIDTERLTDRYSFVYDFSSLESKEVNSYDFLVYSTGELHYLEGSKENAHFVSLGKKGGVNNWLDFNIKDDKTAKYKVTYVGSNIWKVNVKTKLKSLKFESVGELNRADASARFYLGDPFTLTSPVNNQVFLTDTVGFNCSFQDVGTITNLTLVLDGVNNLTISGTSNNTFLETNIVLNEDYHNYTCTGTDSEGYFINSSQVYNFVFSPNPPTVTLTTPPNNLTVLNLPVNNSLVIASSGLFLDSCYYSTSEGVINESYGCNTTLDIEFTSSGIKRIDFCVNDSYFREGCDFANFTLTYISGSVIQEKDIIGEGDINNLLLFVNITPVNATFTADSYLNWNNTFYNYNSKTLLTGGESYQFGYSFIIPNSSGTDNGNNISYTLNFNVSEDYNNLTVNNSQLIYKLSLDDCKANTLNLLNFSLKDEETKSSNDITNGTIKTSASISNSLGVVYEYSSYVNITTNTDTNETNSEQLSLCISPDVLNFSSYYLSLITEYEAYDHVIEYYYMDNLLLSNSTTFNTVNLYDLKIEDSTSFLTTFTNKYYLPVNDAVIDVLRYYTEDGDFISVEHGKTDVDGQTNLHLVAEDVLYTYLVRKDGEIIYTRGDKSKALCLTTPCQINLRDEEGIIKLENIGGLENMAGSFDYDKATRTLTYTYATTDGSTTSMNLDVILKNAYLNETVCSNSQISSAGTLTCILPPSFVNTTFYANVSSGSSFVAETVFNDDNPAYTLHGSTGVLMTFFMFLTLVFLAGSDAIGMLVFGVLGLALAGMLGIFGGGIIIGLGSSLLWLIVAVGIIIYKISQKRRT